jgi:hypothetical protein
MNSWGSGKKITAEDLNSIPAFSFTARGAPSDIAFGQVWTVSREILDWVPRGEETPPLFPIAVIEKDGEIGGIKTCTVVLIHSFKQIAASDDLLLNSSDKPISDGVLALWTKQIMFRGHLSEYIGNLSATTLGYLREMLQPSEKTIFRDRTGAPIVLDDDFRKELRKRLLNQASLLHAPVGLYMNLVERLESTAKKYFDKQVADLEWNSAIRDLFKENVLSREFADACRIAGPDTVSLARMEFTAVDREVERLYSIYGRKSVSAWNKIICLYQKLFADTLNPKVLHRLNEEIDTWNR